MMVMMMLWGYWNGLKALDFVAFLVGPLFLLAYARWDLITTSLICFVIAYLNTCLLALAQRVQKHLLQIFSFSFLSEPVNSEHWTQHAVVLWQFAGQQLLLDLWMSRQQCRRNLPRGRTAVCWSPSSSSVFEQHYCCRHSFLVPVHHFCWFAGTVAATAIIWLSLSAKSSFLMAMRLYESYSGLRWTAHIE